MARQLDSGSSYKTGAAWLRLRRVNLEIEMAKAMHGFVKNAFIYGCRDLRVLPLFPKASEQNEGRVDGFAEARPMTQLCHV